MKLGTLDIKKAYLGTFLLTHNNAFVQEEPIIDAQPVPVDDRLRFVAVENSTFGINKLSTVMSNLSYSLDDGNTWNSLTTSTTVSLNAGQVAYIRGKKTGVGTDSNFTRFTMTGKIAAKGSIMYLYDYETLPNSISYGDTFDFLFEGCSSLVEAPELPAMLDAACAYYAMFKNCTSLVEAPVLPAQQLRGYDYSNMFYGCSSLRKVITYANNVSYTRCIADWLYGVSATGDFYNLGGATYPTGDSGIPSGWTIHTSL